MPVLWAQMPPPISGQGNSFCSVSTTCSPGGTHTELFAPFGVYLQGSVPSTELGPVFAWPQ